MGGASCGFVLFKTINSLNVCLCAGRDYVWGTGKVGVKCEGKWVKLALVTDWNEVCCRPFEACNGRRCIYYFCVLQRCHGNGVIRTWKNKRLFCWLAVRISNNEPLWHWWGLSCCRNTCRNRVGGGKKTNVLLAVDQRSQRRCLIGFGWKTLLWKQTETDDDMIGKNGTFWFSWRDQSRGGRQAAAACFGRSSKTGLVLAAALPPIRQSWRWGPCVRLCVGSHCSCGATWCGPGDPADCRLRDVETGENWASVPRFRPCRPPLCTQTGGSDCTRPECCQSDGRDGSTCSICPPLPSASRKLKVEFWMPCYRWSHFNPQNEWWPVSGRGELLIGKKADSLCWSCVIRTILMMRKFLVRVCRRPLFIGTKYRVSIIRHPNKMDVLISGAFFPKKKKKKKI